MSNNIDRTAVSSVGNTKSVGRSVAFAIVLLTFAIVLLSGVMLSIVGWTGRQSPSVPRPLAHDDFVNTGEQVNVGERAAIQHWPRSVLEPTVGSVFLPEPPSLELVLDRLKPDAESSLGTLLHAAHVFGADCGVTEKGSGELIRIVDLLLDSDRGCNHFGGARPLCPTRYGARFPQHQKAALGTAQPSAEAHPGQTLAVLAGLGVPLTQPILLPNDDSATLRRVLDDLIANFVLEGEIYWDSAALILYVPPARSWRNKFDEEFTFDMLAEELLHREFDESSCTGTHGLITLTILMRADRQRAILSPPIRKKLEEHLKRAANVLVEIQQPDGSWHLDWHTSLTGRGLTRREQRSETTAILATGHHLEWLMMLPDEMRPPDRVFARSAEFLLAALQRQTVDKQWVQRWYCPASHATRAVKILSDSPREQALPAAKSVTTGFEPDTRSDTSRVFPQHGAGKEVPAKWTMSAEQDLAGLQIGTNA